MAVAMPWSFSGSIAILSLLVFWMTSILLIILLTIGQAVVTQKAPGCMTWLR